MLSKYNPLGLYLLIVAFLFFTGCKKGDLHFSENSILEVDFPNIEYSVSMESQTIAVRVGKIVDIRALTPVFTVSPRSKIYPSSGIPQDFTSPVVYSVVAENGSTRQYTIQVTQTELSDANELISFIFSTPDYKVTTSTEQEIHFEFYDNVDLTRIAPIIEVSPYATVTPSSGAFVDLTQPIIYTVRAENGSCKEFKISASNTLSSKALILNFELEGTEQKIELTESNINIYTPYEVDLKSVCPVITLSPHATVMPASGAVVDLSAPQTYTVTASDGTTQDYVVTVKKSPWHCLLKNGEAPFYQVDGHRIIAFNDYLWLLGGWRGNNQDILPGGDVWTSQVWRTQDGIHWENMGDAPWAPRHGFGCVVFQDKLWVIGGDSHTDVWNTPDGIRWTRVNDNLPWAPRYFPYVVAYKDRLWVISGQNLGHFDGYYEKNDDIWCSADGADWVQLVAHAPFVPRGLISGSATLGDNLYLIGGGILGASLLRPMEYNDVWKTNDGQNWQILRKEAPFKPLYWHSVGEHNGLLYACAGMFRGDIHSNELWYSQDGTNWKMQKYNFWLPRHATSVASYKGKLYMIGGTIDPPSARDTQNDVWVMEGNFE